MSPRTKQWRFSSRSASRFSRFPAYVSASRLTRGSSECLNQSTTKLLPMNPAPPVTSTVTATLPRSGGSSRWHWDLASAPRMTHHHADRQQQCGDERNRKPRQGVPGLAFLLWCQGPIDNLDQGALAALVGASQLVLASEQIEQGLLVLELAVLAHVVGSAAFAGLLEPGELRTQCAEHRLLLPHL